MAKNLSYVRSIGTKITVKGFLSDDAKTISYVEKDIEKEVSVSDCLNAFAGEEVVFALSKKQDEELDLNSEE